MRIPTRALIILLVVVGLATVLLAGRGLTIYQAKQTAPVKMGTSGGNVNDISTMYCCSGTLGSVVAKGGSYYILSNNHVLARSDEASTGEDISQPGMVDSNCSTSSSNIVADLSQAAKLGSNVDAAIAQVRPGMVDETGAILTIGAPSSTAGTPSVGMGVAKVGRTTGFTCSSIAATNTNVNVQYETECGGGSTFLVGYTNQVLISSHSFSAGGDSGSLIVNSANARPVALLFAGSSTTTIANPIGSVMTALGVSFAGGGDHAIACGGGKKPRQKVAAATFSKALEAKERHAQRLMNDEAVMAVGVGQDDVDPSEAVVVVVLENGRQLHQLLPDTLDGVKVKVIMSDKIRAWGWNEPTGRSCSVK